MQHKKYMMLAEKNTNLNVIKNPIRAAILDRNGKIIADSHTSFTLIFSGTIEELRYIQKILHQRNYKHEQKKLTIIVPNLNWKHVCEIFLIHEFPIPEIKTSQTRQYYYVSSAHIVGYVSKKNDQDLGVIGIEKNYNHFLTGEAGMENFLITAKRKKSQKRFEINSRQANPLILTINQDLQDYAYKILSSFKKASVIIVDIHTGEILCAVSFPSYDANVFIKKDKNQLNQYLKNPDLPLFSIFSQGVFPSGSTMKPFMLLAGLKKNIPQNYFCNGVYKLGTSIFHCMHDHGHIHISKILSHSCNIPFYILSEYLNKSDIEEIWNQFGFGQNPIPELCSKYPKLIKKDKWRKIDTLFMQIGQVASIVTLAQLVRAYARLASGHKVNLTIIKSKHVKKFDKLDVNEKHLQFIRKSLFDTLNDPAGTAYIGRQVNAAGKTGTAQVKKLQEHEYRKSNKLRIWKYKDHSLFCVFAPYDNPKIAACMIIEHGGSSYTAVIPLLQIIEMSTLKFSVDASLDISL